MFLNLSIPAAALLALKISLPDFVVEALESHPTVTKVENVFPENFFLMETKGESMAGTVSTWGARHLVIVGSRFSELRGNEQRFFLLHECGHMRHRDIRGSAIVDVVAFVAAHVFFPSRIFVSFFLLGKVFNAFYGAIAERRADTFAREHASLEDLDGGIALFQKKALMRSHAWESAHTIRSQCAEIWHRFQYYILQGHPLESSRIAACQKEIASRKADQQFSLATA